MRRGGAAGMNRIMKARLHPDDERGATLVIVVLSLIAMMGMIVLVVDVGGVLWKRRELVNGADAAALAAAKTCADSGDTSDENAIALQYAESNVTDAGTVPLGGGISDIQGCDDGPGFVTVRFTQDKKLFFAPVLGFGDQGTVAGEATAAWGPLGGGDAVPIVIEAGALQGPCEIPDGAEKGDTCPLYYNNGDGSLGEANWGYMNLDQWNVDPGANCSNAGSSKRRTWILNNYDGGPRVLNGDPPGSDDTYVCSDTGHSSANWQDLINRMQDDPYLLFPVNACEPTTEFSGQLDKDGNPVPCGDTPDKYDIIGFIRLKLVWVLEGDDDTESDGTPRAIDAPGASFTCTGQHPPITDSVTGPEIQLGPFGVTNGCFSSAPETYDGLQLFHMEKQGSNWKKDTSRPAYAQCSASGAGCDYIYDPVAGTVEWDAPGTDPEPVWVEFNAHNSGLPGLCGAHSSDPNAICLQMEYQGFTTTGGFVLGGQDFGTYGYVLCDRELETCPDQQS